MSSKVRLQRWPVVLITAAGVLLSGSVLAAPGAGAGTAKHNAAHAVKGKTVAQKVKRNGIVRSVKTAKQAGKQKQQIRKVLRKTQKANLDPATHPDLARNPFILGVETFEKQLDLLQSQGYTTINTGELADFLEGKGTLPAKPILISFDDGYKSFYQYAYPALAKRRMKATLFVTVGKMTLETSPFDPLKLQPLSWLEIEEMGRGKLIDIQAHTFNLHDDRAGLSPLKQASEAEILAAGALRADVGDSTGDPRRRAHRRSGGPAGSAAGGREGFLRKKGSMGGVIHAGAASGEAAGTGGRTRGRGD